MWLEMFVFFFLQMTSSRSVVVVDVVDTTGEA